MARKGPEDGSQAVEAVGERALQRGSLEQDLTWNSVSSALALCIVALMYPKHALLDIESKYFHLWCRRGLLESYQTIKDAICRKEALLRVWSVNDLPNITSIHNHLPAKSKPMT